MRLIDADALDRHWRVPNGVDDEDSYDDGVLMMLNRIENAPTVDAVPVVRCRECDIGMCYSDGSVQCEWSNGFYADDYCPRGKRKGGDE